MGRPKQRAAATPELVAVEEARPEEANVRHLIRDLVLERGEMRVAEIVDEVLATIIQDPTLLRRYLRPGIAGDVRGILAAYRRAAVTAGAGADGAIIVTGNPTAPITEATTVTTPGAFTQRALRAAAHWERWLEHVNGRHIPLLEMTREDLLAAAATRRRRAQAELNVAELWDLLASRLEGGQRLGDRFTTEEIQQAHLVLAQQRQAQLTEAVA